MLQDCALNILALGYSAGDRLPDPLSLVNDHVQQSIRRKSSLLTTFRAPFHPHPISLMVPEENEGVTRIMSGTSWQKNVENPESRIDAAPLWL